MPPSLLFDQIATIARVWDFLIPQSSQSSLLLLSENRLEPVHAFLSTKPARNEKRFTRDPF